MNKLIKNAFLLIFSLTAALWLCAAPAFSAPQMSFSQWIANFRRTALSAGITPQTFALAFKGVNSPDPDVLQKANFQPEFVDPAWNYFDNRVNPHIVAEGRKNARKWKHWLNRIDDRFHVDKYVLLGIWSMETGYGDALKRDDVMRDAIRSLATLAYGDPKRAKFGERQLIAAMKILQNGDIGRAQLRGSWAGALGHTQFIPTSYLAYAVDMDGDGKRDIWNSVPDALGSSANLLAKNGWAQGLRWGYEVRLPKGKNFTEKSLTFAQWKKLGIRTVHSARLPANMPLTLKLPDGKTGPAFLVTKNFSVIKRYNSSDRYALAVGLLADEISGRAELKQDWNRPFTPTTWAGREEIQKRLKQQGFYSGNVDGKIGAGTRQSIIAFEKRHGMEATGYPSKDVLLALRKAAKQHGGKSGHKAR